MSPQLADMMTIQLIPGVRLWVRKPRPQRQRGRRAARRAVYLAAFARRRARLRRGS